MSLHNHLVSVLKLKGRAVVSVPVDVWRVQPQAFCYGSTTISAGYGIILVNMRNIGLVSTQASHTGTGSTCPDHSAAGLLHADVHGY